MVKNLPSVERSNKIRFGRNVLDATEQGENTIIFNASNDVVTAPYSNAVYLSPVRNRIDFSEPEVVLLMYDKKTKEITESGEPATALIGGATLELVVNRGNNATNTVYFESNIGFITTGNVGISNSNPQHTVSVGSNLYIDDVGSNVLVVSGNVAIREDVIIEGNLTVHGGTTVLYTENTAIKDAIIELGKDNTITDETLDLGILMHRPGALSNVVIGYREDTDEFTLAYTDAKPTDKTFTPKTDEDINVHVYGLTHVDANIYAHEDVHITGNLYAYGNVSTDLNIDENLFVSGNVEVTKSLIVGANTHLEGDNVFITHTMDFLDPTTAIVTDQISNVQIRLGQLENVSNLASNPRTNQVLRYINNEWSNDYPQQNFTRVKNGYSVAEGRTLYKGNTVYVSATQNAGLVQVKAAQSHIASQMPCIGLVYEDIPPEGEGIVLTYGILANLKTTHLTAGGTVYVSNVYSGYYTSVKPDDDVSASPDLIQNLGICTRSHQSSGAIFVTGIGRANDIPNAELITNYNEMNYVYVNDTNNDLKKITSANLNIPLTTAVSSSSNSAANAVTLRGVSITSGDGFHGDLVVAGNVTVDSTTLHVDAETNRIGLGTVTPKATLDIVGNVHVTSNVLITGDHATTSKTTGALQVTGGVGIQGDLHATHANLEDVEADSIIVTDTTHSTSKDTGAVIVTQGGLGVEANIHSTNVFAARHIAVGTSATTYALDVRGTSNVGILTTPDITVTNSTDATSKSTGVLNVAGGVGITKQLHAGNTTLDSVKPLNMSTGTIPYTNENKKLVNSLITQEADGTILISANVQITGNISVLGNSFSITSNDLIISDRIIDIANNNTSHELDVGIIMEHPGYNIGLIHHGTHPHHFSIGYTSNAYKDDHVFWNVPNHITANVWGHLITQNTVTIEHNDMYIVNGGLGIGIGQRYDDNVPDSKLYVTGNTHITSNLYVGGSDTTANLFVDTTRRQVGIMTSSPEATLHVTGNAYVSSNLAVNGADLYVDTALNRVGIRTQSPGYNLDVRGTANVGTLTATSGTVTDATPSSSKDTGVLVLTQGGLGVEANIHSTNVFAVSHIGVGVTDGSTTKALDVRGTANVGTFTTTSATVTDEIISDSTTSGALVISGGLGVADNIYVGNDVYIGSNLNVNDTTFHVDSIEGFVGIGTTYPDANLHVTGNVYVTSNVDIGTGYKEQLIPRMSGRVNNVNITALNERTRTSNALAFNSISEWSTISLPANVTDVAWSPELSLFVGVYGINSFTSSDGYNWTQHTISQSVSSGLVRIIWVNELSLFIGVGSQSNVGYIFTSPDGINWMQQTAPDNNVMWRDIIWSPELELLVLVGNNGGGTLLSTDPRIITSPNGIDWTSRVTYGTDERTYEAVTWSPELSLFVAVGRNGNLSQPIVSTSANGIDWTHSSPLSSSYILKGIAWSPELSLFLVTGEANNTFYGFTSPDVITWATNTIPINSTISTRRWDVRWISELSIFVQVGYDYIAGTADGVNWNYYNVPGSWERITWIPEMGMFIASPFFSSDIAISRFAFPTQLNSSMALPGQLSIDIENGGVSVESNIYSTNVFATSHIAVGVEDGTAAYNLDVRGTANVGVLTTGGLITNVGGTVKKTYSVADSLPTNATTAQATFQINFSNHVFYARIYGTLVQNVSTVSSIVQEVTGGHITGGTPANPTLGTTSIIGHSAYPWSTTVLSGINEVTIRADNTLSGDGYYNIFVEYLSPSIDGRVSSIIQGGSNSTTFDY